VRKFKTRDPRRTEGTRRREFDTKNTSIVQRLPMQAWSIELKKRCAIVGCTLYGSTKKHKTLDMRFGKQSDMLLEGEEDFS
jgi:hypothetical protein